MKKAHVLELEATKLEISDVTTEILNQYGLNFEILKLPLLGEHTTKDGGLFHYGTTDFGLFRDDTKECLNTVKNSYRPSQNREVVELALRGIAGFGEISVSKAGALHNGRKVFIQLEVQGIEKVGEDKLKKYITIIDSNDGTTGLSVGISDFTMSCQNQFFRFYKAGEMKMRHSNSMDEKIKELPNLITLALAEQMKLIHAYKQFEKTPVTKKLVDSFVKELVGLNRVDVSKDVDNKIGQKAISNMENLYSHIEKEMKQKKGNLWGLHSGVTSWTTHDKQAPTRDNGRLESIMVGTNYKTNQKSLEMALELVGVEL